MAFLSLLVLVVKIADRSSLMAKIPLAKSADVLADHAEELRMSLGYTEPAADHAAGYSTDNDYLTWADKNLTGADRWKDLSSGRPAVLRFWYRTSPRVLISLNHGGASTFSDPPLAVNGMTGAWFDTTGRLLRFEAAPPQQEPPAPASPARVDWDKLFAAAAINRAAFAETTPSRTPPTFADERHAWQGLLPGTTIPVRVEAAAYRGRPVLFELVMPWTPAPRDASTTPSTSGNGNPFFIAALLIVAAVAARINVKSGRADRKGGFRLGTFVFSYVVLQWLLDRHVMDAPDELLRAFTRIGIALFLAVVLDMIYLGLEPFVRRSWPTVLVGWSRVLCGRPRDPLVGRDLLIGAACGAALGIVNLLPSLIPTWRGLPEPMPYLTDAGALLGTRPALAGVITCVNQAVQTALILVFDYVAYRTLLIRIWTEACRRLSGRLAWFRVPRPIPEWIVAIVPIAFIAFGPMFGHDFRQGLIDAAIQAGSVTLMLVVLLNAGLFATCVMLFVTNCLNTLSMTFDAAKPYAGSSWMTLGAIIAMAALGFWMARSGEKPSSALRFAGQ